ncbi:hypothetical protein PPACK8108_LOCUS10157 [Phakopsora pachyrhizi]|uniref:Phenylalanyl-tRNA synthetase domain-containing protein n=1 Tax=Phakopsora pachyrhizi TaxID=170000 RepID=A0AAV0B041_PHAPC|nr:hypothetical protein PPACK8108_LOCUS10157 [Phakopsora pachyrhizi]
MLYEISKALRENNQSGDGEGDGEFKALKMFSIDRAFRNKTVDTTHLAEFHQGALRITRRSSESRALSRYLRIVPKDGVAPEEDTVTDDRNKRERSRVRRWIEADDSQMRERMM